MARTSAWCSRHGWLVGFVWGLAESTVFFMGPGGGGAFVGAMSARNWWKAALTSIVGTLVGAVLVYLAVRFWLGAHARDLLLWVPGIHAATLGVASRHISDHGAAALLPAAIQGIPYKVYATQLTLADVSLPALLVWTIPSGALRLVPVAAAAGAAGQVLQGSLRRHFGLWVGAYV